MTATEAADPVAAGTPSEDAVLLEVNDLRVSFATKAGPLHALDGVSLVIPRGASTGIVGESGSGKSMLLRTIMGILPDNAQVSDSARISFEGTDLRRIDATRARHFLGVEMSMVFQDPMTSLTPVLKVGRQMTEPLRYHLGLSRAAATRRAAELLREVGISEPAQRLKQYPHSLSGGMRQRVIIAMALACEPKLLLADEPTTALDVTIQRQVLRLLRRTQLERQMAMVLVTHDLGVVANNTDYIMVMYAGRIVERAPTRTLFAEMAHPYSQALLASIPRLSNPSHTPLQAIPGRPASPIDRSAGCAFAPRCRYAQPRCLEEDPVLRSTGTPYHDHACFFPVGSPEGQEALEVNVRRGRTVAGLGMANGQVQG